MSDQEPHELEVDIEWTIVCHECGHEHEKTVHTTAGVEYGPELVPRECDACEFPLRDEDHAWHRTFEIVDYRTFPITP